MKPYSSLNWIYQRAELFYNWIRGYGFYWVEAPGTPAGGYFDMKEGTCPYPVIFDWSIKACNKAGAAFVGIEVHEPYFDIACQRIENAQRQERLFA